MNTNEALYRLLVLFGFVAVAAGVAVVISPALAGAVAALNLLTAGLVAFVALVMGLWLVRVRLSSEVSQTEIPDPEFPLATPAPGNDVDDWIDRIIFQRQGTIEFRNQIRERLGNVAAAVIMHRDDCTREEAIEQLQDGSWTDDQRAAAFFTGESPMAAGGRSIVDRLGDLLGSDDEHPTRRSVRVVVDAIVRRAGMTETLVVDEDEEDAGFRERLGRLLSGAEDEDEREGGFGEFDIGEEGELVAEGVRYRSQRNTGQWIGVSAFALIATAVGFFTFQAAGLVAAGVAAAFAAYARVGSPPPLSNLEVTRRLSDESPTPGDEVEVTVTVENTGDGFLPDLRIVDRVPGRMRVVEGCPRRGTALAAGDETSFRYTVIAERGEHEWPLQVVGRDFSGSVEREAVFEVDAEMECVPRLRTTSEMPVRSQTSVFSGQVNTDIGGSGLEFHQVREYQHGDPMRRINWSRLAKTGELSTIDMREERAATVVLLFDTRESAYVSPTEDAKHAVDRSVEAAGEVFASLYDNGDLVGIAAFDTIPCWLAPGAGDEHVERARLLLATHPAVSSLPPDATEAESQYVDPMTHIRRQLPTDTQIVMFSPLTDNYSAEVARRLDGAGHRVTVISPDATASETPGERLARVERTMRITNLREHEIRVVDWEYDSSLRLDLERAEQRWGA